MVHFPEDWFALVGEEFTKPYFQTLIENLKTRKAAGETIYPPWADIFRAFRLTPFEQVKIVILGQDPYHGPWQAHGLSFSVPDGIPVPPSLKNIYQEIYNELWGILPTTGNLTSWATQGVLLLNAILTVQAHMPASHHGLGREQFTDTVIATLSAQKEHCVFLLWGNFAKSKKSLIDTTKHLVLEAPHPSPFSAHSWFFGCGHFSATNQRLVAKVMAPIVRLPNWWRE